MGTIDWLFIEHLITIGGVLFAVWFIVAALVLLIGWSSKL